MLFTLLNQMFAPVVAYALTAGPTAPEATNFEPIDTTDMVNPLTGGFTYSLPLLEVPGPEGGYPLALSYHAGIQPNEEASWVGLGWSLNPGSIARNVNGYPDDWSGGGGTMLNNWAGQSQSTYSIGVNIGFTGTPASVNFGLSFSQDTYRGFGVGGSMGVGESFGPKSPLGIGAQIGVSPFGGGYVGTNLFYSAGAIGGTGLRSSVSVGLQTNFQTVSGTLSGGVSTSASSVLGASLSTSNIKPSLSVGGGAIASVNDADKGKISTSSNGFSVPIPITPGVSISLGYQHVRYWSNTSSNFTANGVINNRSSINAIADLNTTDDDNYSLLDPVNSNVIDNPDPLKQLGGTYPNFDNYSVTAQGLGGNMRPYAFATVLFNQNRKNNGDQSNDVYGQNISSSAAPPTLGKKWQFRFLNDLSNSYRQGQPWSADQSYNFDGNPQYGNNDGTYGYDATTNRLEGTNHIEYFTNAQIINKTAAQRGFIDCDETGGFNRADFNLPNQIGGFMITNASGVTYHYALPAYSSQEVVYTQNKDGSNTNTLAKNTPYAYTWYLTAITGPDYVSRGTAGMISNNDWGYWVKFVYGKWTDGYEWRTPGIGMKADLDNRFLSCSSGVKDVYYLDAVKTRTHTALFVKDQRPDARSYGNSSGVPTTSAGYDGSSVQSLELNSILLLKNDQFNATISTIRATGNLIGTGANSTNVIDISDISQLAESLPPKCLRKIAFNYDNSLSPGAPNSFTSDNNLRKLGKLTLLSVDFQGKGGIPMTPPMQFQYDLDSSDPVNQGNIFITQAPTNQAGTNQPGMIQVKTANRFSVGDILTFQILGSTYWCTLLSTSDGGSTFKVLFLNNSPGPTSIFTLLDVQKTKNPPFNYDAYDNWGCYKSDYVPSPTGNQNLSRFTTPISNSSTDVWSLRKIASSIGAEIAINYEGNTYNRSVLNKNRSLVMTSFTRNGVNDYTFAINSEGLDINTIYKNGDNISFVLSKAVIQNPYNITNPVINAASAINSESYSTKPVIESISGNSITVRIDPKMDADIQSVNGFQILNEAQGTYVPTNSGNSIAVILSGNAVANGATHFYGGGIRVRDLITDDLNGFVSKSSFDYTMPGNQNGDTFSSGITSYEPLVFDITSAFTVPQFNSKAFTSNNNYPDPILKKELYKNESKLLAIARELPSPGVMYEYVTVRDYSVLSNGVSVPVDGKTTYQYEVFKPEMIGIYDYNNQGPVNIAPPYPALPSINGISSFAKVQAKKDRSIKDYTSRIGNLKRVITYDNNGNKLTEKINHYLHDDLGNTTFQNQVSGYEPRLASYNGVSYNSMGVIKERYGNVHLVYNSSAPGVNYYSSELMLSDKETFPTIQTGTTQIDYKNGTRMDQTNLAYDYYTGAVTKTLTSDSYGNRFVNQVTPAYAAGNRTAYPALGLKTHDDVTGAVQHKQMLTQQASNYTFSVDNNNTPIGVVTASVQTWSNTIPVTDPNENAVADNSQSNIWRMEKSLSWMSSGSSANNLTPYSSFVDYFASGGSSNASWKKTSQITQYNVYSAALEASDINNNYAATRMGYNSSKALITGGPAKYNEIAYAGAEDALLSNGYFSNNISKGAGTIVVDSTNAHTGTNSLLVTAGNNGFTYSVPVAKLNAAQNYHVSVWVKPATGSGFNQAQLYYTVNGATVTPTQTYSKTAANWCLLEMTVPSSAVTGTTLVVGCKNASAVSMYFDDFRFQPVAASASAYVYDNKNGELTYILDNNNLFTRYRYDAIGRLIRVYKEVLGKTNTPLIKDISYNYAKMSGFCAVPPVDQPPTSSTGAGSFVTPNPMDKEWKMEAPPGYTMADDDGTTINAGKKAGLNAGRFAYFSTAGTVVPLTYINGTLTFSAKGSGTIEIQLLSTSNNSIQARKTFTLTSAFQNYSWTITNLYPQVEMIAAIMVNGGNSSLQASVQFQNNFNLNLTQLGLGTTYTRFRADETSMIGNAEKNWYGWSDQYNAPRKKYLQHSAYARMRFQTSATHIAIEYVRDFYDKRVVNLFPVTQVQNNTVWDANGNVVAGAGSVSTYTQVTGGQVYTISGLLTTNPTIVWYRNGSPLGAPTALTSNTPAGQPPVYQVTAPSNATNMGLLVQNKNDSYKAYFNCMVQQGTIGTATPLDGVIPSAYIPFSGYTPSHISGPAIFINGTLYKYYQVEGNDIAKVIQFVADDLPAGDKTVEVMMPGQGTYLPADPHTRRAGTYLRAVYFPGTTTTQTTTAKPGSIVYVHDSILSGYNISNDAQNNVWMMALQRNPAYGFPGEVFSEGYAGRILNTDVATPELTTTFAGKLASFGVDKYWFQVGVNDFGFNTPLPVFYTQYKSLIEQLKALRPNAKIYIQSTGPEFYEGGNGETVADDGLTSNGPSANDFRDVQRAIATSHSYCEYVDFENLFPATINNLSDGIHPTDAGNALYANGVKNKSTLLGTVLPVLPLAFYRASTRHMVQTVPGIYTITATGGKAPYTFSKQAGTLPGGLTFNNDGTITGTPALGGSFLMSVKVTDANNNSSTQQFTLNVDLLPAVTVGPQHIINAQVNVPYSQSFIGYYGYGPYTFSITSGSIPSGMSFDGATGILSGTPLSVGTASFTVSATDHYGFRGSSDYTLVTGTTSPLGLTDTFSVSGTVDANNHLWVTGHLNDIYPQTVFSYVAAYFTPSGGNQIYLNGNNVNIAVGQKASSPVDMGAMGLSPGSFSIRLVNGGILPSAIDNVNIGYIATTTQSLTTTAASPQEQFTITLKVDGQGHLLVTGHLPHPASTTIFSAVGVGVTENGLSNYFPGPAEGVTISAGALDSQPVDYGFIKALPGTASARIFIGGVSPTADSGYVINFAPTTDVSLFIPEPSPPF
ncbi:MAG: putative Ig domain-containing protein [Mucilaginibacter sp.]|uniref:putative Ig domain-containing protein n=1 Tax=Mucilaginibacter sp. TaxID=1882438 RepID=UPI0031B12CE0